MNLKTALLGTVHQKMVGTERDMLRAAGMSGLQQQAGYVPGVPGVTGDDYEPLPGKVVQLSNHKYKTQVAGVYERFHTYGTIAGSAALWQMYYDDENALGWIPNDVDVFCYSEQTYKACRTAHADYYVSTENERGFVLPLAIQTVNILKPLPDEDWSNPYNILKDFDLTISAVALPQLDVAYVLYPEDTLIGRINFVRVTSTPIKLIQRVMKYIQRGYKLGSDFWSDAYKVPAMQPVLHMLDELNEFRVIGTDGFTEFMRDISASLPRDNSSDVNSMDDSDDYDDYDRYTSSSIDLYWGSDEWDDEDDELEAAGFWDDEDDDDEDED